MFKKPRLLFYLLLALQITPCNASLIISQINQNQVISFDSTVNGVNNGKFAGTGFAANPSVGQLDSDAWSTTGWSDGPLNYGGSFASGDHARGVATSAVTTAGMYAYGTTDVALLIQAAAGDFDPGTLTLRVQNNTGQTISKWNVGYEAYLRNDSPNDSWMRLELSANNTDWFIPIFEHMVGANNSGGSSDSLGWRLAQTHSYTFENTRISVDNGNYLYMRWNVYNQAGIGSPFNSRDEWGIDDITIGAVAAVPEPATCGWVLFMMSVGFCYRRRAAQ